MLERDQLPSGQHNRIRLDRLDTEHCVATSGADAADDVLQSMLGLLLVAIFKQACATATETWWWRRRRRWKHSDINAAEMKLYLSIM